MSANVFLFYGSFRLLIIIFLAALSPLFARWSELEPTAMPIKKSLPAKDLWLVSSSPTSSTTSYLYPCCLKPEWWQVRGLGHDQSWRWSSPSTGISLDTVSLGRTSSPAFLLRKYMCNNTKAVGQVPDKKATLSFQRKVTLKSAATSAWSCSSQYRARS